MLAVTKDLVLSGKPFTATNNKGETYYYKVERAENEAKASKKNDHYFAKVYTGDPAKLTTETKYTYIGIVDYKDGTIRFTKASKFADTAKEYLVLAWTLKQIWSQKTLPAGYSIRTFEASST